MPKTKPKILVIVGPTASGKTALSIKLAKKYHGEIVSADSRQVYKGMNIGSGKITKQEMAGIPHHLLDVADPKKPFSVVDYQKLAHQAVAGIIKRGNLPIVVGGTGFYIQAIVDNFILPEVPLNPTLRKKLTKLSVLEIYTILVKLDRTRAKTIDKNNPVRLIRAIEIATALGKVPKIKTKPLYNVVMIGIKPTEETLKKNIHIRLLKRLRQGMVAEVSGLHTKGLSWKKLEAFGLEYRYVAQLLQSKISKSEMIAKLETEIYQYAKRQMTWFKRDKRIEWIES